MNVFLPDELWLRIFDEAEPGARRALAATSHRLRRLEPVAPRPWAELEHDLTAPPLGLSQRAALQAIAAGRQWARMENRLPSPNRALLRTYRERLEMAERIVGLRPSRDPATGTSMRVPAVGFETLLATAALAALGVAVEISAPHGLSLPRSAARIAVGGAQWWLSTWALERPNHGPWPRADVVDPALAGVFVVIESLRSGTFALCSLSARVGLVACSLAPPPEGFLAHAAVAEGLVSGMVLLQALSALWIQARGRTRPWLRQDWTEEALAAERRVSCWSVIGALAGAPPPRPGKGASYLPARPPAGVDIFDFAAVAADTAEATSLSSER